MKRFVKAAFGWMKESNRPKHIGAGAGILLVWLAFCIFLLGMGLFESSVTAFLSVLVGMCSCEFKDREYGGVWDWLDVAAGCVVPFVVVLVVLLFT